MKQIIPAPLYRGDTIGVISPSSYITEDDLTKAVSVVERHGYNVYVHPQTLNKHNQSAGNDSDKIDAFHDLIKNPDIQAIIFSTGGNRALHWVDQIDWELVQANPKIIMGFSDITSILNLVTSKTGLRTFHGPNLRWFMVNEDNTDDTKQCFEMLACTDGVPDIISQHNLPLVGGNLSILQYLTNDIDFTDKTLLIEDWNIELSHADRMLMHLKRQGVFDKVKGVIIGQFDNLTDTGRPYGFTFDDIIAEHIPNDKIIMTNAPFGHGKRLITLPVG